MAHIILVEPDRVLAETYRQALQTDGHTVTPCASAQAAIFAADQQQPDVVLLELQLIEHSGIEFLYEFRSYEEWQPVPVIILTQVPAGEFASNWRLLRQQLGVQSYLYKPQTSLQQLRQAVKSGLVVAA
jgi:DNA-binding response OmpR family regulator